MDNQQQQQMNITPQRPVKDLLVLGAGAVVLALIAAWGARQVVPEWRPPL